MVQAILVGDNLGFNPFRDLYIYSNIELFSDCFPYWIDGRCQSANQNLPTVPINVLAPRPQSSNIYQCFGWTYEYGWKMEARLRLWTCGGRFHVSFEISFENCRQKKKDIFTTGSSLTLAKMLSAEKRKQQAKMHQKFFLSTIIK